MKITRATAVVDTHTGGEPTRLIIGGAPYIPGKSISEKWVNVHKNFDDFRVYTTCEPRGHGDMVSALFVPPIHPEAHFGIIFLETGGGITMCGHGSIGVARAAVELGWIPKTEPLTEVVLDTPAGLVKLYVEVQDGEVGEVTLHNVPSFLYKKDIPLQVPSLGKEILLDISYGGSFFALIPVESVGLSIDPKDSSKLISLGLEIRDLVNENVSMVHPTETHIKRVELVEFYSQQDRHTASNAVIFGEGSLDRSPCGTGTSAKMAALAAKGKLDPGEIFNYSSITGSVFRGSYEPGPKVGEFDSILPTIRGKAYVTGFNYLVLTEEDELGSGFVLQR